jgi:peptide/nickel transport system permease protein
MLWASRVAMGIGFVSQAIALTLGILVGAMMGYFGGIFDLLGMRLVEMVEAVPTFFLILTFIAIFGRSILMIMIILGVTGWTGYARFLRAEFLRIRQLDYIVAARAAGLPLWRIMFRHMLPNGLTPVLVSASFGLAGAVTIESSLSYLGVGVRPPTPSWGGMLNAAGNPATVFHWFEAIPPGMALFLTVLAFNIVGEALRDAIDPKSLS